MEPDIEAAPLLSEGEGSGDYSDANSQDSGTRLHIPESSNAPDERKSSRISFTKFINRLFLVGLGVFEAHFKFSTVALLLFTAAKRQHIPTI